MHICSGMHARGVWGARGGRGLPETATARTVVAAGTRMVSTGPAAGVSFSSSSFRSSVVGVNTASVADGVSCRPHTQPQACHLITTLCGWYVGGCGGGRVGGQTSCKH